MKIFDIKENKVVLNATSLAIPEFKEIYESDESIAKEKALREISYIVFNGDMTLDNPYRNYQEDEREGILRKEFLKGKAPRENLKVALEKFKKLHETVAVRLLRSAKRAADKLAEYFDNVDFNEKDSQGRLIYSARDVASNLKEIGNIVKSLTTLEDQVRKEQVSSDKVRGGGEIGDYELPDKNFDYGNDA